MHPSFVETFWVKFLCGYWVGEVACALGFEASRFLERRESCQSIYIDLFRRSLEFETVGKLSSGAFYTWLSCLSYWLIGNGDHYSSLDYEIFIVWFEPSLSLVFVSKRSLLLSHHSGAVIKLQPQHVTSQPARLANLLVASFRQHERKWFTWHNILRARLHGSTLYHFQCSLETSTNFKDCTYHEQPRRRMVEEVEVL